MKSLQLNRVIVAKANEGKELSGSEQFALSLLFHDLFFAAAYSYASATSGGSIHEEDADVDYIVLILRQNPCAIAEWNRVDHLVEKMGPNFVTLVNSKIGN